jgi:hypothetical protein
MKANRREQGSIFMRTHFSLNLPAWPEISGLRPFALLAVLAVPLGGARIAQAQDPILIKDPAEFSAFQQCSIRSDHNARASCLEVFLRAHPESPAKMAFLDSLIDTYEGLNDADHALSAARRQLQVDPGNMKAIFVSVFIDKSRCLKAVDQKTARSFDPQACNDAAELARKGLSLPKHDGVSDDDWKKLTAGVYPVFHSAIALDDAFSRREYKNAVAEYTKELKLYTDDQTKTAGLWDTLLLASTYARPEVNDPVKTIWFYARVSGFAPAEYKAAVDGQLDYYYKTYHGNLNGLDEIKTLASETLFPPESFIISPAAASGGRPAQPGRRLAAAPPKSLAQLIPEAKLPLAASHTPGTAIWPANEKPIDASIAWDSHGLVISANNSSLQQILKEVGAVTGATVDGLNADERIFGVYGPGKARDVLTELLRGTGYNVLMIGDQGEGTPREIVLSARNAAGKTVATANPTQANDDDADADDQPQPPPQPLVRPPFGPGGQRNPQQMRPQPGMPPQQPPNSPQN